MSNRCKHDLFPDECANCLELLTPEEEEAKEHYDMDQLIERLNNAVRNST